MVKRKLVKTTYPIPRQAATFIDERFRSFLLGRIWLEENLPFHAHTIRYYRTQQLISFKKGIENASCNRCFSKKLYAFSCSKCLTTCHYCLQCIQMGRVSTCSELVQWIGAPVKALENQQILTWQGMLTATQRQVAEHCMQSEADYLIHAVTGAGKTEILFPIIEQALKKQQRVCLATPRTDVVLELYPRLQQAFAEMNVQALYGGSGIQKSYSNLIVATTHQLIRFEQAFDLIIIDEVDAFPYTYDAILKIAVKKSLKKDGRTILVSATPSAEEQQLYKRKNNYAFLARRFHRFDLPVPRYSTLWNYQQQLQTKLPPKLQHWIEQCLAKNLPFLLFFPSIQLMKKAAPLVQQLHPKIEAVHASEVQRKKYVQKLRERKLRGLLTTTILERGITIADLQVAVIGAESPIFDRSALIQIAGRVGRAKENPTGDIVFFHNGITRQMDAARKEIIRLNEYEDSADE